MKKVGLMGFGKAGKAVASVLMQSDDVELEWILRRTRKLEHRSAQEFLGYDSAYDTLIYSVEEMDAATLFDEKPVDCIIDFSSAEGVRYYGEAAAERAITIISTISHYPEENLAYLETLAERTRVVYSPNITVGINFLIIAARILKSIAPYTDIEVIEQHYKAKPEISGTAKVIARRLGVPLRQIKTVRAGGIISNHEILFGFPYQTVRLKHESITREAFGNGILFILANMPEEPVGLFTVEDLMIPYFQSHTPKGALLEKGNRLWWKLS